MVHSQSGLVKLQRKVFAMKLALYPGTFDPVTNGHLDILHRACKLFDHITVAVANNQRKGPLFSLEERVELIRGNIRGLNASVEPFQGLVVDFAKKKGAIALIRGLRAVSDFEFEFQMTQMNRDLDPEVETIFLMPGSLYYFTSSTLVKQVSAFDPERVQKFIPLNVAAALKKKYNHS